MKGSFNEKSLLAYSEMVAEKTAVDFAEGEVYDFTRCVRANGSFYGTSGRCRQGSPAGPKEEEAPKGRQGRSDLPTAADKKSALDAIRNEAAKRAAAGDEKGVDAAIKAYARLAKAQTKEEEAPKTTVPAKTAPTLGELAAARKQLSDKWQDTRAAASKAQNEHKFLTQRLRGDNSPEAKAQLLKSGKALDKAQQVRDRAQRAWQKVDDKIDRENAVKKPEGEFSSFDKLTQDQRDRRVRQQTELVRDLKKDGNADWKSERDRLDRMLDKDKEVAAKKPEAPLRGQNLANKMMDHVNISNRVAANHGGAIRTKAAKEEHAAELKKAGVPDRATLTAALKAQRDEGKKSQ